MLVWWKLLHTNTPTDCDASIYWYLSEVCRKECLNSVSAGHYRYICMMKITTHLYTQWLMSFLNIGIPGLLLNTNNALSRQLPLMRRLIFAYWCWMTSYHVSVLYDNSIEMGGLNNGAQCYKCGLQPSPGVCKLCIDWTATRFTVLENKLVDNPLTGLFSRCLCMPVW